MKKKGTYEWVSKTFNIEEGCKYNCQYPCYARLIRRKKEDVWIKPIFKENWFNQKLDNYEKGFLANCMCFSAHDIYSENQENCLKFILRLMNETNNTVLITSKANIDTIKYLCENLGEFKERISFMITITSMHDSLSVVYEPNAPFIEERMLCLEYLNYWNWFFHVNIEPYLDRNPVFLVEKIFRIYSKVRTIWIGCFSRRNYKHHTLLNMEMIKKDISYLPDNLKKKVYLKNSFVDKLERLSKLRDEKLN
jgi:DNA repair photolyase